MTQSAVDESENARDKESGRIEGRRLRGLSWNKTHQLWRVRIYYNGKLRFVGRFEDATAAARAYDKAAVYLYGASAITNFGLEACLNDPTEVGACIVRAKEEAEQQAALRQHSGSSSSASGSPGSSPGGNRHQHSDMQLSQSPLQNSPDDCSFSSFQSTAGGSIFPSADSTSSSFNSLSQLDALLMLTGAGAASTAAAGAGAAAEPHVAPFPQCRTQFSASGIGRFMVGSNTVFTHRVAGTPADDLHRSTSTAAVAPIPVMTDMNSSLADFNVLPIIHQPRSQICGRSTSLPGVGYACTAAAAAAAPCASSANCGGFLDQGDAVSVNRLLNIATTQQQLSQWQQQDLGLLPRHMQVHTGSGLCADLAAMSSCNNSQLSASSMPLQVQITAHCTAASATLGTPAALQNQQLLLQLQLQQQQQEVFLQQQLLQQQLKAMALQEAMLTNTAAAAAAAVAAFPSASGSTSASSSAAACGGLLFSNSGTGTSFTPLGYTAAAAAGTASLVPRWSLPI